MSEALTKERSQYLEMQYEDLNQQSQAATLGMWLFLATEVLFFGGLFLAYIVYRVSYPTVFAKAGKELNLNIGTTNTAILLTSSYLMALSVHAIQANHKRKTASFLAGTWILGVIFLCLKAYEYYDDIEKRLVPGNSIHYIGPNPEIARLFYFIYYSMTGLHALHLSIGLGIIAVMFCKTLKNEFSSQYYNPIEVTGLYWHFVDVIWIFLYPLLYLLDRHS
jgi:cytochrome c oxidase subunit 3